MTNPSKIPPLEELLGGEQCLNLLLESTNTPREYNAIFAEFLSLLRGKLKSSYQIDKNCQQIKNAIAHAQANNLPKTEL